MRLKFTKMQGAGNDFVVLDGTAAPVALSTAQLRHLGDRRLGVGADQVLAIEAATSPDVDFRYRIFNGASGEEVEHCGNGARCFMKYVLDRGLSEKRVLQVQTMNRLLHLQMYPDGQVGVDMAQPVFEHSAIPFESRGLVPRGEGHFDLWPVEGAELAVLSMGNPHAVMRVSDVDMAPVATLGPRLEEHERFARRVNVGFMQVVSSSEIKLRVFERDAGETPACGTGACAAVVAGIRLGWLGPQVKVHTRGGMLDIAWAGIGHAVQMRGPATTVFEGEIEL